MDFSDPVVLANTMIFHDALIQQMRNTTPSTFPPTPNYYSSPVYQGQRFDRYGVYNDGFVSEYSFPIPIEDSINNPIILEDVLHKKEYMKMVMGRYEGILLVSIFLQSPILFQLSQIKFIVLDRIREFIKEDDEIMIVISGKRSKEFDDSLLKDLKLSFKYIGNRLIIYDKKKE